MALDVRLSRDVDEPWGFELFGGADEEMPLTIEKIEPDSPAKRAGLLNGDTILTINGEEAIDLSLEAACRKVEESGHSITVGVLRGLYDPVLDDQEPIYDYQLEDLGPQSEPTEVVFQIQQFVEPSDLGSNLLEYDATGANIPSSESRSLTASPFVTPTKPYRPFSTEPINEVPPLEDPIILNPDYRDQFGRSPIDNDPDYILNSHYSNLLGESRFKLPISEQYDPDGTRFKQDKEIVDKLLKYERHVKSLSKDLEVTDITKETIIREDVVTDKKDVVITDVRKESLSKDVKFENKDVRISKESKIEGGSVSTEKKEMRKEVEVESISEELKYIEKMKQEIDLKKIEETAMSVVEDSIERAVSVAEEIKKEIDQELVTSEQVVSEIEQKVSKSEESEEILERKEMKSEVERKEYAERKISKEERFESENIAEKDIKESETLETVSKKEGKVAVQRESLESEEHEKVREEPRRKESHVTFENKGEFRKVSQSVTSGTNSDKSAEQRAFTIGLQTIPNIRGVVHSSYHYDLLLRTFFLHLTDVMVALSRFLLAQPIFSQLEASTKSTTSTTQMTGEARKTQEFVEKKVQEAKTQVAETKMDRRQLITPVPVIEKQEVKAVSKKIEKDVKVESMQEKKVEIKEVVKPVAVKKAVQVEAQQEKKIEKAEEVIEKKTGAQMAQRTEKKLTQEMAKKMDAVISEFQTIAVEDEKKEILRRSSRSRSRSHIEEEVLKESDPLEWLSKVDSKRSSQERSEFSKKQFSASETIEKKSLVETKEVKQRRSKSPKNTYIAIVESHVYTNKDAIFEELVADISETSSVQSAEEISTAVEAIETICTENVALESAIRELETAKIVEEKCELATVAAESAATVQKIEEVMHESKELIQEEVKKEESAKIVEEKHEQATVTATSAATVQKIEDVIHESKELIQKEVKKEETAKIVEEKHEQATVTATSAATVKKIEEVIDESKELIQEEVKKEETAKIVEEKHEQATVTATSAATVQEIEEVMHESKELIQKEFKKEETAKILEETRGLAVIGKSAATVKKIEEITHESKDLIQEEIKKETAIQSTDIQEVLIHETNEIVEPIVELKKAILKEEKVAVDISESLSVAESTEVSIEESKTELSKFEIKEEQVEIKEEERTMGKIVENKPEVMEPKPIEIVEITETVKVKPKLTQQEEYAALKIVKMVEPEGNLSPEIIEVQDVSELISKSFISKVGDTKVGEAKQVTFSADVSIAKSDIKKELANVSESTVISKEAVSESKTSELIQESTFTAKSADKKLSLRTDLDIQESLQSPPSTINTPTPSTVPPTPLTEEYVFKLKLPLPKSRSATPVPRDCTLSPEDEDPHIVKKKLIPHIETTIERVVYDPPLPSPTIEEPQSPVYNKPVLNGGAGRPIPRYVKPGLRGGAIRFPVYRKPGLFGGADKPEYSKEEIREIERKSSLLASAIDETIKSIEEYKEEVGIETKKEVKIQEYIEEKVSKTYQESYVKEESTQNGFKEIDTQIEEIMEQCNSLADFDKDKTVEDTTPIISENVETVNQEIESKPIEIDTNIEDKHISKTVKFENQVQIVEVENGENRTIVEKLPTTPQFKIAPAVEINTVIEPEIPVQVNNTPEIADELNSKAKLENTEETTQKSDVLLGFRPVVFDPENIQKRGQYVTIQEPAGTQEPRQSPYITESGELMGTIQGIVDGLEEPVMDAEVAKELGKPGISEEKIATLISGEAEMLREAHVMGLSRVLTSHMHRADDSSVDFQKIKPMLNSLKDSEVIKALNEELMRQKAEEKKKEEKKWTTFLQKPKRPVPKAKFGYHGWTEEEQIVTEPYKVKIVKQAKPKVAPDYKPEDFETGPLPWEERAATESSLPPAEPEEPILIPEVPEFLEAVDPLKESEVPDLEDTGLPLPPPREPTPPPIEEEEAPEPVPEVQEVQEVTEETPQAEEKQGTQEEMENRLAEQLVRSVQGMVDPNASIDQQLAQMRAQLAALAQLPEVIQQSLELVSQQLSKMSQQEAHAEMQVSHEETQQYQQVEAQNHMGSEMQTIQEVNENIVDAQPEEAQTEQKMLMIMPAEEKIEPQQQLLPQENNIRTTPVMTEEEIRMEKQKKEQARLEHESRLIKQHPTPRAAKPKRVFGPLDPEERVAVVLPGGRRWRNTEDVYNEQKIAEMFEAHSELIQGKAIGFESDLLPFDSRINFMKYEKPPVSLDHLKHSEVYKLVHNMDQTPLKRVETRTPIMSEADYRERCRSMTPSADKKHMQIPQQFHP